MIDVSTIWVERHFKKCFILKLFGNFIIFIVSFCNLNYKIFDYIYYNGTFFDKMLLNAKWVLVFYN